jgi:hypothetical protein
VPETRFQGCLECGRLRWHRRGHVSLGIVRKDYHLSLNERAGLPGTESDDTDPRF